MDYKAIAKAILLCGSEPSVRRCEKECPYYKGGDTKKCIPRMTKDASAAITDLLARAEAAEARAEKAEKQLREAKKCVSGLSLMLKAIDGKMVMDKVLPIARSRLEEYREKYPSKKVVLDCKEEE